MVAKAEKTGGYRWKIDFNGRAKNTWHNAPNLAGPIGYCDDFERVPDHEQDDNNAHLIVKRSWDIALVPIKQVPMNMFVMWMTGNTLSIFPIIMTVMMFKSPLTSLLSYKTTFQKLEGSHHILQKMVYVMSHILLIAMALWKCNAMGLLPIHPSDWIAFESPKLRTEFATGGSILMS